MSSIKEQLYKELYTKARVIANGINVKPGIFKNLALGSEYMEQVHGLAESDRHTHVGVDFPCHFTSPGGFTYNFVWDLRSPISIEYRDGSFYLYDTGKELFPITFAKRPHYYGLKTSDGVEMSHIANFTPGNTVRAAYSNECSLKDKGLDCLFCNANVTKDTYAEKEDIKWKTPKQIAETVAAAYKYDGSRHIQITGGFIPERREVEYYLDVAEAIQEHIGERNFDGNACVGAPQDISIIEKYKEAGYRTIAINIELWDNNFFKTICPGKEQECGGWEHWVKALEYSASVFGCGNAGTNFVAGIEPKEKTLEGIEYLASKGVVATAGAFNPNAGSKLEGHRSPGEEWNIDLAQKAYRIYKNAGFTFDNLYYVAPADNTLIHDVFKIEEGLFQVQQEEKSGK